MILASGAADARFLHGFSLILGNFPYFYVILSTRISSFSKKGRNFKLLNKFVALFIRKKYLFLNFKSETTIIIMKNKIKFK